MFDAQLNRMLAPGLNRAARHLAGLGLRADQVTLAGFVFGILAGLAILPGWHGLALGLFAVNRLADGLDGAIARHQGPTDRGAFLDIMADFLIYSWLPFCFALADPAQALAAAFLIFSFLGTGASFLAYAILAERSQIKPEQNLQKGFFYLGGLTEGGETVLVLGAMLAFPQFFVGLAVIFGLCCWLTTGWRIYAGWQNFSSQPRP